MNENEFDPTAGPTLAAEREEAAKFAPPYSEVEAAAAVLRYLAKDCPKRADEIVRLCEPYAGDALHEMLVDTLKYSPTARLQYASKLHHKLQLEPLVKRALEVHGHEERVRTLTGLYPDPNQELIDAFTPRRPS